MKIEKKVALLKKICLIFLVKNLNIFFSSSDLFVFKYANDFFWDVSKWDKNEVKNKENCELFYEILSLLAIFEPIDLTLNNISENKHLYF